MLLSYICQFAGVVLIGVMTVPVVRLYREKRSDTTVEGTIRWGQLFIEGRTELLAMAIGAVLVLYPLLAPQDIERLKAQQAGDRQKLQIEIDRLKAQQPEYKEVEQPLVTASHVPGSHNPISMWAVVYDTQAWPGQTKTIMVPVISTPDYNPKLVLWLSCGVPLEVQIPIRKATNGKISLPSLGIDAQGGPCGDYDNVKNINESDKNKFKQ